jgi:hypothetical protein
MIRPISSLRPVASCEASGSELEPRTTFYPCRFCLLRPVT